MENFLNILNEQQKEAVVHKNGPLLIIAGPGSGKTRVLTYRIVYLITAGINPENILAVTFTNKAAEEMKERVVDILQNLNLKIDKMPFIGTFHSFCVKVLRQYIYKLGYSTKFTIYDEDDSLNLIKHILKKLEFNGEQFKAGMVKDIISRLKNEMIFPESYFNKADNFFEKKIAEVYLEYQKELKAKNAVDFDDLLLLTVDLFAKDEDILKKFHDKFHYILIDEFQDTNIVQYQLCKFLAEKSGNICVVGDTDQSIYGWRAADYRNVLKFESDWPNAKIIKLEENYRSTPEILELANNLIVKNIKRSSKTIWTRNPNGAKPVIQETRDEREEAEFILSEIKNLINQGYEPKDFVILYRINAQSRPLEECFIKNNFPYKIIGSLRFYQRKEIKDIISWLRFISNSNDIVSLTRIISITEGVGAATLEKILKLGIENLAKENKIIKNILDLKLYLNSYLQKHTLFETLQEFLKKTNYKNYLEKHFGKNLFYSGMINEAEARWENVKEILSIVKKYNHLEGEEALNNFLEEMSLFSEADEFDENKNVVHLMTIHCVKGLEFSVVFMAGLEDGLLPYAKSSFSIEDLEEERRLCYVGITRAKKNLYLTFARKRTIFGSCLVNMPSRFLSDIPEDIVDFRVKDNYSFLIEEDNEGEGNEDNF